MAYCEIQQPGNRLGQNGKWQAQESLSAQLEDPDASEVNFNIIPDYLGRVSFVFFINIGLICNVTI
jgi:hypothetical protein